MYRRSSKSRNTRSTRRNNIGRDRNRMACRKRSTSGSDWNGGSGCNTGLRKEGYATNDNGAIFARDVCVKIWTRGRVTDLWLEVLLLTHCEVLAEMGRAGVDKGCSN
jgi:hypothetical protein